MIAIGRPEADEYDDWFAGYVARIKDDESVLDVLDEQVGQVAGRLGRLAEDRGDYRYAAGKWSVKEVVGHLSDTERVFAYRALRIGRGDATALSGFDDQSYVPEMGSDERSLPEILEEWETVRRATLTLLHGFPVAAWRRLGSASDAPISVRALAYIIAGHTRHHMETLVERYGV
jgi:hypothetical protein